MKDYLYLTMLFVCAMTDIVTYKIKNIVLAVPVCILLIYEYSPGQITDMCIIFIVFVPFYFTGLIKAGDIKLLMAAAAFTGISSLVETSVYAAFISFIIIIFLGLVTKTPVSKIKIPFAFTFFLGSFPIFAI